MIMLIVFLIGLYFMPMFIAMARSHKSLAGVAIVNSFLGWTLIGWVIAFVWSLMD